MKFYEHDAGHMTKMVAMPLYCINPLKSSSPEPVLRWQSGAVVRASDFGQRGPWFDPRPVHISLWP